MIELRKYSINLKKDWDDLIRSSRIDSFLFFRDYMDYHSNRFEDLSFFIYRKSKLVAVLPGNLVGNTYYSHQGLTYGGIITTTNLALVDVIETFKKLNKILRETGVSEVIYKPTPHIYHKTPAEEDLYVLFLLKAQRVSSNISSTIYQRNRIPFIESRKSGIRKAKRNGVEVKEMKEYSKFWDLLSKNLISKYRIAPVHSLEEIENLTKYFPENIKLYAAVINEEIIGGTVLYLMENIVHVQYISANEKGKELGALDLIFQTLINELYTDKLIFDFGQSTEENGTHLNENLIFQKEGFGGRGIVYDTFSYRI
jgi:hypothetical protein